MTTAWILCGVAAVIIVVLMGFCIGRLIRMNASQRRAMGVFLFGDGGGRDAG